MDIYKALEQLRAEKRRLDAAIAALEQAQTRRDEERQGRVWNAEARRRAAERMRKYWEQRRKSDSPGGAGGDAPLTGPPAES